MGPLAPFPEGWLVLGRAVGQTSSLPKVFPALFVLPWLSVHLIDQIVQQRTVWKDPVSGPPRPEV